MDETGIQLEHNPGKIVARKGTKYLQSNTSDKRETITVIAAVSAGGKRQPPHFIIKKSLLSLHTEDAPEGSTCSVLELISLMHNCKRIIQNMWISNYDLAYVT